MVCIHDSPLKLRKKVFEIYRRYPLIGVLTASSSEDFGMFQEL